MAGYTNSDDGEVIGNHGGQDAWVVKLDADGFIQWQKPLGGSSLEYAYYAEQARDNSGYLINSRTSCSKNVAGHRAVKVDKIVDGQSYQTKKAIEKHLEGVSLFDIMAELKVSERWFYKWLKRYRGDPNGLWYEEQSKRPKTSSSKYRDVQVEQVKAVRAELLSVKYAQVGAVNIQYKLQERGYELIPVWAINRILKRENLIGKPLKERGKTLPILATSI